MRALEGPGGICSHVLSRRIFITFVVVTCCASRTIVEDCADFVPSFFLNDDGVDCLIRDFSFDMGISTSPVSFNCHLAGASSRDLSKTLD